MIEEKNGIIPYIEIAISIINKEINNIKNNTEIEILGIVETIKIDKIRKNTKEKIINTKKIQNQGQITVPQNQNQDLNLDLN